jgi:hypothetical protein
MREVTLHRSYPFAAYLRNIYFVLMLTDPEKKGAQSGYELASAACCAYLKIKLTRHGTCTTYALH